MTVPYAFGTATSAIPLSQLDSNFNTPITLGNTAIQLGNTVTTLNNMTLANVTITSGSVTITSGNATVTNANVTSTLNLGGLTASTALALDASKNVVSVTNTGTGNNVLASSPTLTTPNLGTPSAVTLTNATGLPLSTGVTGTLGTTNGGTGLTSFTSGGVVYASGTGTLATGSALTFDGTSFGVGTSSLSALAQRTIDLNAASNSALVFKAADTTFAYLYADNTANEFRMYGAASKNLTFYANAAEGMRLTSTGLGIGTSSPGFKLQVIGTSQLSLSGAGTQQVLQLNNSDGTAGTQAVKLGFSSSGVTKSSINAAVYGNDYMTFNVGSDTERARITSGGYFKASDNGTYLGSTGPYHELDSSDASNATAIVRATNASYTGNVLQIRAARNTTNNTFSAIRYYNEGAAADKFLVYDSGNAVNTNGSYGTISDIKMKIDIVDAGSQWADIKAIRFRRFKMKDDPDQRVQLGVVAQELEQTSPGLVDEHTDRDAEGNDLGTTTKSVKTSVLLMKAAKALQEAMERIEALEAQVAQLKGN